MNLYDQNVTAFPIYFMTVNRNLAYCHVKTISGQEIHIVIECCHYEYSSD